MTMDVGRVGAADRALAVPAEPSSTVSALTGFDPSRLRSLATEFVRNANEYALLATANSWTDFQAADSALFNIEQAMRCERLAYAVEHHVAEQNGGSDANA
jgi:hypothetical protein